MAVLILLVCVSTYNGNTRKPSGNTRASYIARYRAMRVCGVGLSARDQQFRDGSYIAGMCEYLYWESCHAYFLCIIFIHLSSSSLTFTHKIGLTSCCLNYLSHASKHICLFLVSQYLVHLFLLETFLFFLTTIRAALHLKYSTP